MLIYTIQEKKYLNKYFKNKIKPGQVICFEDFRRPYEWLNKTLSKKNKHFKKNEYHFWGWIEKPDLRTHRHYMEKNKTYNLLTLNIPDELIVLSDYQLWHFVLNGSLLYKSEKQYKQFSQKHKMDYHNYWKLSNKKMKKEIEESWEEIFKVKFKNNKHNIQAHFPAIKNDYIIEVKEFQGANSRH